MVSIILVCDYTDASIYPLWPHRRIWTKYKIKLSAFIIITYPRSVSCCDWRCCNLWCTTPSRLVMNTIVGNVVSAMLGSLCRACVCSSVDVSSLLAQVGTSFKHHCTVPVENDTEPGQFGTILNHSTVNKLCTKVECITTTSLSILQT